MSHLKFPEFDDIPVSTKTIIVKLNIVIDLARLVESLPFVKYVIIPKRRGRKKKDPPPDPNEGIPSGSIITLQFGDILRGVDLKQRKKDNNKAPKKRGFFRNAATIVMVIDGKNINFKVCHNGKFQMTGCKSDEHAKMVVKYMWDYIRNFPDIYSFEDGCDNFEAILVPAMRNIDFSLGFYVNREELDSYINEETEYTSLLETSFGYTGVNIKIPMNKDIRSLRLEKMICIDKTDINGYSRVEGEEELVKDSVNGGSDDKWDITNVLYDEFLDTLSQKDRDKKLNKERNNTFLVFHSGKIILSGLCPEVQRDVYYEFLNIIRESYKWIEERLDDDFEDRPRRNKCITKNCDSDGYYDWENEVEDPTVIPEGSHTI